MLLALIGDVASQIATRLILLLVHISARMSSPQGDLLTLPREAAPSLVIFNPLLCLVFFLALSPQKITLCIHGFY